MKKLISFLKEYAGKLLLVGFIAFLVTVIFFNG